MAEVNVSREIAAPVDKVWAVLSNPSRFEEWLTVHTKFKGEPPTEIHQGSTFSEVVTIMGMPNTIDWNVETYDAASHTMKISGAGMAGAQVSFQFSLAAAGDGCVATINSEFISQMMVGAIGAAVERASHTEVTASLDKLSALVA